MENSQKSKTWPEKVIGQLMETHIPIPVGRSRPGYKDPDLYIVVGAKSGMPMCFIPFFDEHGKHILSDEHLGFFTQAHHRLDNGRPVQIFDRSTALYLIGQHAISQSLFAADSIEYIGDKEAKEEAVQETLMLMPVFGAMIPQCITSNSTEK